MHTPAIHTTFCNRDMILLVDCDQFFVQCARLADPEGAGREALLLVGGSAEGRGVVTSASYETRAFGVRSGMPTGQALRLCPQAKVVGVPRGLCSEKSRAIRGVLERFTPVVEPASIDEAYMDMAGTERLYNNEPVADTARRIQQEVYEHTAIRVSIGGGTNKLVAKMAVSRGKPNGVHIVAPGGEAAFLAEHEIGDIPGVGPSFVKELQKYGLKHVADALHLTPVQLGNMFGERRGAWLHARMRGIGRDELETQHVARSMSRDETFGTNINDDASLARELRRLIHRLARDLREDGSRARTITVRIRDAVDFRTRQASRTVDHAIETEPAIYEIARALLQRLRADRRTAARLIGVSASNLTDNTDQQTTLFGTETPLESERDRALARVRDRLEQRFGRDAVKPADQM